MATAHEFALISAHFSGLTPLPSEVRLGIGDDAALVDVPAGHELVVTTDTLVAERHFPADASAYDIGWKSLAVNLSDLAAMGAEPRWFTLALTLPEGDEGWVAEFACGLQALAAQEKVALIGGDTTQGPLSITVTAMGLVPSGLALRRSGAQVGDLVAVTGTLGDAALGLHFWRDEASPEHTRNAVAIDALYARLNRPQPRLAAGLALRGLAHAAIDLSDGIAGDLAHIASASRVGAEVRVPHLPVSPAFARLAPPELRVQLQAGGGDDYELCVCIAPAQLNEARDRLDRLGLPLHVVGAVVPQSGVRFLDVAGQALSSPPQAYRHFS
jgi:thiamine-monophosphate kinase